MGIGRDMGFHPSGHFILQNIPVQIPVNAGPHQYANYLPKQSHLCQPLPLVYH